MLTVVSKFEIHKVRDTPSKVLRFLPAHCLNSSTVHIIRGYDQRRRMVHTDTCLPLSSFLGVIQHLPKA